MRLKNIKTKAHVPEEAKAEEEAADGLLPVSPVGRLFLEPSFYTCIMCVLEFKNRIEIGAFRKTMMESFAKHPRAHSKIVEKGRAKGLYWAPTEIEIEKHVVEADLTEEERASLTPVEDFVSRLASSPMFDRDRPLWEAHIINITRSNSEASCVFRIHHALGDGMSLMSLLLACTRQASNPALLPTIPGQGAKRASREAPPINPSDSEKPELKEEGSEEEKIESESEQAKEEGKVMDGTEGKEEKPNATRPAILSSSSKVLSRKGPKIGALGWIMKMIEVVWNTMLHMWAFLLMVAFVGDSKTAVKGQKGNEKIARQIGVSDAFPISDLSEIKKAFRATLTDVMIAVIAGGINRFLTLQNSAPSSGGSSGLRGLRVRALTLVNLRPTPGLQELSDLMVGSTRVEVRWGNPLGYILVRLPVDTTMNPLERIKKVKKMTYSKKRSFEAYLAYVNGATSMKLLGPKGASVLTERAALQTTMSLASVMGPFEEVALDGNPITSIIPTVVGHPHALTCHIQTYNNKVYVVASASKTHIPDIKQFCDCITSSFLEIQEAFAKNVDSS